MSRHLLKKFFWNFCVPLICWSCPAAVGQIVGDADIVGAVVYEVSVVLMLFLIMLMVVRH